MTKSKNTSFSLIRLDCINIDALEEKFSVRSDLGNKLNAAHILKQLALIFSILILPSSANSAAIYVDCQTEKHFKHHCSAEEQFIYVFAKIDRATTLHFEKLDAAISQNETFPIVYVNSIGGDIYEAMRIGEILRKRKATVKSLDVLNPDKAAICESSCLLLAAGATSRYLDEIGIHQPYYEVWQGQTRTRSAADDKHEKAQETYFEKMGISNDLITLMRNTPYDTVQRFSYTDKQPLEKQEIFRFGFRMEKDNGTGKRSTLEFRDYDIRSVMSELEDVAKSGDKDAAFDLGFIYYFERPKTSSNLDNGIRWLTEAARLKRNKAAEVLGMIYYGSFHRQHTNIQNSIRYFQHAAENGCPISQSNLGWLYLDGIGMKRDFMRASFWISNSAIGGLPYAYSSLGSLWLKMDPSSFGRKQAYHWLKLADETMRAGSEREANAKELKKVIDSMHENEVSSEDKVLIEWKTLGLYYSVPQKRCD